tara:strand:+ start:83 stop:238 length:156 start_codon:yes stop_codon:yes gene_type:complete
MEDSSFQILSSSVVEQSAVNRLVIGSNPIWGVKNNTAMLFSNELFICYNVK